MCVAIIGGLGYIGRHLVQQLLVLGFKVLIIDKNDDRLLVNDLRKFDRTGKQLTVIKLNLPVINSRFKDLIISNNVNTVINVMGVQENSVKTLHLAKFVYCYLSTSCKKVKTYIHTTPMEDNIGYGYDKRLKIDVYPENWLAYHTIHDNGTHLKVGVLRLSESYGHDKRLRHRPSKSLWCQLEGIRNGLIEKLPVHAEAIDTEDSTHLRDYCSVFDTAGGIIDMMTYINKAKGFDFAACDIGSGVDLSVKQFIDIYKKHYGVKVVTDPILTDVPRGVLKGDPIGGGEMIGWTRIANSTILNNDELNTDFLEFEDHLLKQQVC